VARGPHDHLLATVPAYAELVTAYERADAEREHELADDDEPRRPSTEPLSTVDSESVEVGGMGTVS
jgi:hypothetical protein